MPNGVMVEVTADMEDTAAVGVEACTVDMVAMEDMDVDMVDMVAGAEATVAMAGMVATDTADKSSSWT